MNSMVEGLWRQVLGRIPKNADIIDLKSIFIIRFRLKIDYVNDRFSPTQVGFQQLTHCVTTAFLEKTAPSSGPKTEPTFPEHSSIA